VSTTEYQGNGIEANDFSGVYVPDDERWPKHFRGMGIRVEDSVYVGETNPIVLTAEAPKEIEDIEALRD
jgi:intermediate cleaving peptidase 55